MRFLIDKRILIKKDKMIVNKIITLAKCSFEINKNESVETIKD